MARQRSKRKLIKDRIDRCINAINENIRRLEEITGFYAEGEDARPTQYIKLMAMVDELRKAELKMLEAYQSFLEYGKP